MRGGGRCRRWTGVALLVPLLGSCGGGGESAVDATELPRSQVSGLGVVIDMPSGWSSLNSRDHGLQIAANAEDLGAAEAPSGPRLTVTSGNTALPEPTATIDALADPASTGTELVREPQTMFVGDTEGVGVELVQVDGGTAVVRRWVFVNTDGTNVLQFLLEAPEEQWAGGVTTMESILRSTTYEPGGSAVGPTSTVPTTGATNTTTSGGVPSSTVAESAIRGAGTADDPYQLPYHEAYSAPVDDRWIEHATSDFGDWTWDVVADELVTTAQNVGHLLPRAPWVAEFDLPESGVEVHIEATQPTAGTSCGLALYFRDSPYDGGIGLLIDSTAQRVLLWAPIGGQRPAEDQWVTSSQIRQGDTNQIRMSIDSLGSADSDELSVYVNDQLVTTLASGWSESLGPPFGFSPLALVEPDVGAGECRFDNFSVTASTP